MNSSSSLSAAMIYYYLQCTLFEVMENNVFADGRANWGNMSHMSTHRIRQCTPRKIK